MNNSVVMVQAIKDNTGQVKPSRVYKSFNKDFKRLKKCYGFYLKDNFLSDLKKNLKESIGDFKLYSNDDWNNAYLIEFEIIFKHTAKKYKDIFKNTMDNQVLNNFNQDYNMGA